MSEIFIYEINREFKKMSDPAGQISPDPDPPPAGCRERKPLLISSKQRTGRISIS